MKIVVYWLAGKVGINALSERGTGSCLLYEKRLLAMLVPHSVAANIRNVFPFLRHGRRKDFFIMIKKFLGLKKLTVRDLVLLAMMISLSVVLERYLAFTTPLVRVSFSFIANVVSAIVIGPLWTGVMAVIADFIGSFLSGYAPFLPISICKFLYGFTFGIFLYNFRHNVFNISVCVVLQNIFVSLFMMSYFLTFTSGSTFEVILVTRLVLVAVNILVQITVSILICKFLAPKLLNIYNRRV